MDPIEYLLSIETKGIKLGFQRTEKLLEACGNPHIGIKSIQVAGTNGKGSVCAIISNIFKTSGYKTGLFTSPHLIKLNERIRINGITIPNESINIFIKKYKKSIETIQATFFESMTAMAFWYFKKQKVDIAILETGLGGRLDSVTICKPIITIITPISLDHIEILGDTIQKIAYEKAGILKNGIKCISAWQEPTVVDVLNDVAKKQNTSIQFLPKKISTQYSLNIPGKNQQENAHLSISALSFIKNFNFSKISINKGLKTVKWYGRNQIIQKKPLIIFDVGHNVAGIKSFLNYYNNLSINGISVLVIALHARKKIDSVIPNLISKFKFIICTQTVGRNSMPANILSNLFVLDKNIKIISNPEKAISWGMKKLKDSDSMAIIGTHYLGTAISNVFKISFDKY